jgi:hypothetical protein
VTGESNKPIVVTLCGSTRFRDAFTVAQFRETLDGKIVLTIGCSLRDDVQLFGDFTDAELKRTKQRLDWLHMRKIDLSDEILVLNVDGYIGDSTSREIAYAWQKGKDIRWLLNPHPGHEHQVAAGFWQKWADDILLRSDCPDPAFVVTAANGGRL